MVKRDETNVVSYCGLKIYFNLYMRRSCVAGRRLLYSPFLYTHTAATQNGDRGVVLLVLSSSLSLSPLPMTQLFIHVFFFLTWQQLGKFFFSLFVVFRVIVLSLSTICHVQISSRCTKKKRERIEMFFLLFLFFLWPLVDCDNTTKHDTHRRL